MRNTSKLQTSLSRTANEVSLMLDTLLPKPANHKEDILFEAMRYSTLSNGKRIRPFLVMEVSRMFDVDTKYAIRVASAIEMIHSYSLIHDDLPSIDNDDLRRGEPSCHKKFGEATAILAGDALLTYAFEIITDNETHPSPNIRSELGYIIAKASGYKGMVGGQTIDILSEQKNLTHEEIINLQNMKTGALFRTSCEAGAILGEANSTQKDALLSYASNIGLAFQITDDILDISGDEKKLGKSIGKDIKSEKATLVSLWGIDKSKAYLERLVEESIKELSIFDSEADTLRELALFFISRDK